MWNMSTTNVLVLVLLVSLASFSARATVSYDDKAFIINGKRKILISGSIHYPRSTPEMWPDLIQKAKDGGLDVIQTYVFWNGHEPSPGKFNFEGRYDLVKFIKLVHQAGLYAHLRIGPYVCAEWNFGGFPVWLKYVPGIEFRTDKEPFKVAMQGFVGRIVNMMKSESLFEPQGGPIIMSQIENEYGPVEWEIDAPGKAYSAWAAKMAVAQNTGVPWIMCKQETAPDPMIDACNGSTAKTSNQTNLINPKCLQKSGLAGIHNMVVQFLNDLLKTWLLQWPGLFRTMVHSSIITCIMEEQTLVERRLVFLLPLAMIMMPQLMNMEKMKSMKLSNANEDEEMKDCLNQSKKHLDPETDCSVESYALKRIEPSGGDLKF